MKKVMHHLHQKRKALRNWEKQLFEQLHGIGLSVVETVLLIVVLIGLIVYASAATSIQRPGGNGRTTSTYDSTTTDSTSTFIQRPGGNR